MAYTYGDWGWVTITTTSSAPTTSYSAWENVTTAGSRHGSAGLVRRNFLCDGCSLTKVDDYTVRLERPTVSVQIAWDSFRNGGYPGQPGTAE